MKLFGAAMVATLCSVNAVDISLFEDEISGEGDNLS